MLTAKQCEALELLIEHKTSKEISRILGISPHTVDQRIDGARARLGFASRGELAHAYRTRRMAGADLSERLTHENSHMPIPSVPAEAGVGERGGRLQGGSFLLGRDELAKVSDHRVVPELFDGQLGTLARLAAIFLITLLILMAVLAGFSTYVTISESFAR